MAKQDQRVPPGVNVAPPPEVPDTHGTLAKYTVRIPIFPHKHAGRFTGKFVATVDICGVNGERMVGRGVPGAQETELMALFKAVVVASELLDEQVKREAWLPEGSDKSK